MSHHEPFDASVVDCAWVMDRADEFADGSGSELAPAAREAIAAHARGCEACRDEIEETARLLSQLHALGRFDVPARVVERAASLAGDSAPASRPRLFPRLVGWAPAAIAAAALAALVATARWSPAPPIDAAPVGANDIEQAARETAVALSYLNRYARYTGEIVEDEVLGRRVIGTMERAIESSREEVLDRGLAPVFRRAMKKSGLVETKEPQQRS